MGHIGSKGSPRGLKELKWRSKVFKGTLSELKWGPRGLRGTQRGSKWHKEVQGAQRVHKRAQRGLRGLKVSEKYYGGSRGLKGTLTG